MSIGKLVRHFEGLGKVPVDIKDVLTETRALFGNSLTIKVRGVDVDPGRLRGNCYRYQIDDSSILVPRQVAMIVYNKRFHAFEQRLVCCKELVHLADPDPIYTSKKEQVLYLAEELIKRDKKLDSPMPMKDLQVFFDLLARWHALAILFPFGASTYVKGIIPKSNALGHGGRAAQLKAQGVPGGVIGEIARRKGAAPGQKNYHGKNRKGLLG